MKRIILSSILTVFMFFNTTLSSLIRPEISVANGVPANATFYQEKISNDLTRFNDYKVIYDGLVTSRVAIAGTTRLFLNIYNDNYNLVDQFIYSSIDYPNLVSTSIIVQSLPIRIDNLVYIYFYQRVNQSTFRHHVVMIDVDTSILSSIELTITNPVLTPITNDIVELDFVDNKLHLMIARNISTYAAYAIEYSLNPNQAGFSSGTTSAVINSGITNSAANIVPVTADSVIGYCYRFIATIYCKDKLNSNIYSLTTNGVLISNIVAANQTYLAQVSTIVIDGVTRDIINYYIIRKNANSNALEAYLAEVIDLSYANNNSPNNNIVFAHINRSSNQFKLLSMATYYTYNYLTDELITNGYQPASYEDVYYNSNGQKILVSKQDDLIYASSDFYALTFVINLANHNVLAYNYYQDDLLIFGYDNARSIYAYYKYPILPSSGGSSLVELFTVTTDELRTSLGFTYNVDPYNTQIQIDQVIFYKNAVFMLDVNTLSAGTATSKLNLIQILPIGTNVKRIDSLYYNFTGSENISFTFPNTLDYWHRLNSSYYFSVKVGLLNGELVELYLNNDQDEFFTATQTSSFRYIAYFNYPSANLDSSELDLNGADQLVYINDLSKVRDIILVIEDFIIFDNYGSGADRISTQIPLPMQILESYVQGTYPFFYQNFDYQFPYESIFIRLDEHGNLILKDKYNNIYTLYSRLFLNLNNPGIISINNQYLDINANSFDLAVSANINSILINIGAFFNRVLVTNPTPITLNNGQNVINITLKSLDNTINSITFNIFKAPTVVAPPAIVLPGPDPNYVPPSSGGQGSSSVSSSPISSSISSSSTTSSTVISSSSSNMIISSSSSSISGGNPATNQPENPLNIWIILAIPALITGAIIGYAKLVKGRSKSEVKVEEKKDEVEIPNSENKDKQ